MLDRRGLLAGMTALATARVAHAEDQAETIPLWPDLPPGGPVSIGPEIVGPNGAVSSVATPRMVLRRPAHPNGAAVLILGGGGYRRIGIGKESQPAAHFLAALGVTTFVLYYRLPNSGWPLEAPFQDSQRAMRLIRARAPTLGLDTTRLGILGFSAGGHLAGMTAARPDDKRYTPIDAADELSARPDFAGLIYPVLTLMPPFITKVSTATLLGEAPTLEQRVGLSIERQVTHQMPPTFLVHAGDDGIAPPENSLLMFEALRANRVPAALHLFRAGGHGFNLGKSGSEVSAWPNLFTTFAGLGS